MRKLQLGIKRCFDFVFSLLMIIILSPVLLIIALLVKISSPGKAVFTQERMGKDQKRFNICKFRTMKNPPIGTYSVDGVLYKPSGDILEPSITRVTRIGKILRKTSLDELMQLFNIFNGSMSFVGPRPTLPYQAEKYTEEQKRRFALRPGVTGLAQVNGRNTLTWVEKIQYDLEYVDRFSILLDLKILIKTVAVVFKGEGINLEKEDPMTAKK
ncbi:MAG: sugar transferase [Lachnospiraceae bacterium]